MKFQVLERNWRKFGYLILLIIVFLIFSFFVSRTFSFYEEHQKFDVIKGKISNQNYDTSFSFFIEDEQKNMKNVSSIPSGKDYTISVVCDKGAIGSWNYEKWAPVVRNLTETRTKCQIIFREMQPTFLEVIKKVSVVSSGDGLYEVHHENSDFTETFSADLSENQISQFGETELRYVGNNPNNYVKFNDELWRIIGFVNTPEGQRVKLIRNESIGDYSWDTSENNINATFGINEWSQADLQKYLNEEYYTNILSESKDMIDNITWNLGGNGADLYSNITTQKSYNWERGNQTGKICSDGEFCTDTLTRTLTWQGKVGLVYPSDYGYATSGGSAANRTTCLTSSMSTWVPDCSENNWMNKNTNTLTISPLATEKHAYSIFIIGTQGTMASSVATTPRAALPTIYLKSNLKIISGNGTLNTPFSLEK